MHAPVPWRVPSPCGSTLRKDPSEVSWGASCAVTPGLGKGWLAMLPWGAAVAEVHGSPLAVLRRMHQKLFDCISTLLLQLQLCPGR